MEEQLPPPIEWAPLQFVHDGFVAYAEDDTKYIGLDAGPP
jgi:hypothetical protein